VSESSLSDFAVILLWWGNCGQGGRVQVYKLPYVLLMQLYRLCHNSQYSDHDVFWACLNIFIENSSLFLLVCQLSDQEMLR